MRSFVHSVLVGTFITTLCLFAGSQPTAAVSTEENPKGESQFASHLKSSEGASNFSRSKTIREQREYLPVFAVRENLMQVVRDNQGKHT